MDADKLYRRYYGENYEKAMENIKKGNLLAKTSLLRKYPHATLSKFSFTTTVGKDGEIEKSDVWFENSDVLSTNLDSDTFRNDRSMWIWLHNNKGGQKEKEKQKLVKPTGHPGFPGVWLSDGTVFPLPKGNTHSFTRFGKRNEYSDGFPVSNVLDYPINNFRVYVNGEDYFMSKLPELKIGFPGKPFVWDDDGSYFQTIFSVYCASYCCGISLQHLTQSDSVYPVVTSIARYHLYFTVRRLLRRMVGDESMYAISKEFGASKLYRQVEKLPWTFSYEPFKNSKGVRGVHNINVVNPGYKDHYKRFVPKKSNGLTSIGLQYLNQSIEAYVYAVLGAQAKTRVSIVDHGGGSLESQQEFRNLTNDAILNYSVSTWILNMNKSIKDTFVTQDLAITPKGWLVPSKMVILKEPIIGYNNLLKIASPSMVFGVNPKVNYQEVHKEEPKKLHQESGPHLETLDNKPTTHTPSKPTTHTPDKPVTHTPSEPTTHTPNKPVTHTPGKQPKPDNELGILLVLTVLFGYLLSEYVL